MSSSFSTPENALRKAKGASPHAPPCALRHHSCLIAR
jgi:hypothetical protein